MSDSVTGAFVRIKRDDSYQNIDFAQLTDDELTQFSEDHPERGWSWAIFLAKWIRDNVAKD